MHSKNQIKNSNNNINRDNVDATKIRLTRYNKSPILVIKMIGIIFINIFSVNSDLCGRLHFIHFNKKK